MNYENLIKGWIYDEYNEVCKGRNYNIKSAIDRCYGVIMFGCNVLFKDYNEELAKWWDDEMLPKFRELEKMEGK